MKSIPRSNLIFIVVVISLGLFFLGKSWYLKPDVSKHEVAPTFSATLMDGKPFLLEDLQGDFVLLEFWGSWCGPCHEGFPELRALYDDFHFRNKEGKPGFQIVSVGIESQKELWIATILRNNLKWRYHLSDLQMFESPVAALYGIREVPSKILIDPAGEIVAVNPSFSKIRKILDHSIPGNESD